MAYIFPAILNKFSFMHELFQGSSFLYFWSFGGIIILFAAIFGTYVNFLLFFAKVKRKKYEIKILSDGKAQVIIEK